MPSLHIFRSRVLFHRYWAGRHNRRLPRMHQGNVLLSILRSRLLFCSFGSAFCYSNSARMMSTSSKPLHENSELNISLITLAMADSTHHSTLIDKISSISSIAVMMTINISVLSVFYHHRRVVTTSPSLYGCQLPRSVLTTFS